MIIEQWPYFLILGVCILIFALFAIVELRLFWRQRSEAKRKEQFERDLSRALSREGFLFEPGDFHVTRSAGLKMGGMPEQIWVAVKHRYAAPIPYRRDDIVERIERREQSRPGHYYVADVEVRADLIVLAELALGGSRAAVDWFGRHHDEFGGSPASFLQNGGDEAKVAGHLKSMLSCSAPTEREARP
ncbi:hypothetical protein [Falsirhodobacter xinxiangensis]|uniref:hypothetical protein n=1 Tax=Falsirhodobacter xinxiangensis TaxID=2530049 RepID=UPI0010A9FACA|nr:hypothetical protein [Rhodobacter xinxiangensis]